MSEAELIDLARNLAVNNLNINPQLLGEGKLVDAAVIYFGKDSDSRLEICLDKKTGAFIGATMTPGFEPKN